MAFRQTVVGHFKRIKSQTYIFSNASECLSIRRQLFSQSKVFYQAGHARGVGSVDTQQLRFKASNSAQSTGHEGEPEQSIALSETKPTHKEPKVSLSSGTTSKEECCSPPTTSRIAFLPDMKYFSAAPYSVRLFDMLGLANFSKTELRAAFEKLDVNNDGVLHAAEVKQLVREVANTNTSANIKNVEQDTNQFVRQFMTEFAKPAPENRCAIPDPGITYEQFESKVLEIANRVDHRVYPIAFCMFMTGCAIGVIVPVMPLLSRELGLSVADFGVVVSAFGLTKLLGNIPSATLSDRVGRRPLLTGGMALISLGMASISLCSSMEELVACRLITGAGVSAFTTSATLYLTDLSNPFNRTKTMAPITASFSAGAAAGPAMGGVLATNLGLNNTFLLAGALFGMLSVYNRTVLTETLSRSSRLAARKRHAQGILSSTINQWKPLFRDKRVLAILMMNSVYWLALSGSQMTLLPMMLTDPRFELTPAGIGGMFALMSAVGVVGAQPAAYLADKFGKPPVIVGACSILAGSMFCFPHASNYTEMVMLLTIWASGGTLLGMAPTAYVADLVPSESRSQALALMRTMGDVGLLCGATLTGHIAEASTNNTAMQANSMVLLGTSAWFGISSLAWKRNLELLGHKTK